MVSFTPNIKGYFRFKANPEFPGRMRGSRFATTLFTKKPFTRYFVSRRVLETGFNIALKAANLTDDQVQAVREHLFGQKLLNWETRKDVTEEGFPQNLWHYHFRKAILRESTPSRFACVNALREWVFGKDIAWHCGELNRIIGQEIFFARDGQFKVVPVKEGEETKPLDLPYPAGEKPIETALKEILKSNVATSAQAYRLLVEKVKINEDEFEALKGLLCANRTLSITSDGYMYLFADWKMLIDAGRLVPISGQEQLRSNENLEAELLNGTIVRVFHSAGCKYYLPEAYSEAAKAEKHVEYLTAFGRAWIKEEDMDYVEAAEKILVGRTADGTAVAIKNTPALRAKHANLLLNYEMSRLLKLLVGVPEGKRDEMVNELAITARETGQPLYLIIYQARKMMQMGMLLDDANYFFKPARSGRSQNDIRAWPFHLITGQKRQLQNFMSMQRKVSGGIFGAVAFLAERLGRAVYQPETLTSDNWEELRALCYSVAAQNGYDRIAAKCKDLFYMFKLPEIYLQGVDHYVEKTELSRRQAEIWLEEEAVPQIKAAVMKRFGLRDDEVWVFHPPKTYSSTGRKVEAREKAGSKEVTTDMLRARAMIRCHSVTDQAGEERSLNVLRQAKPILVRKLSPVREVEDYLDHSRSSGWQGLQVHGKINGKPFELLAQTEAMFRREKKADAKQMHWARDVNKDLPETQLFDEIPPHVAHRLTLLPGRDYDVLREMDDNYLHVQIGTERDNPGLLPVKGDIIPPEQVANMAFYPKCASINVENQENRVPTPWDFYKGAKQVSADFKQLHSFGVYRFKRDARGRAILVRKRYKEGEPKTLNDGDVLLFFRHRKKEQAHTGFGYLNLLRNVVKEAVSPYVRYQALCELEAAISANGAALAERERKKRERAAKISEGKVLFHAVLEEVKKASGDSKTVFAATEAELIQSIARILNFDNIDNFLHALALEYVFRDTLLLCLDHMGYHYSVIPYTSGDYTVITFTLPDQKGILRRLNQMGVIKGGLKTLRTSPYVSFKLNRVEVTFGIESKEKFDAKKLEQALDSLLREARFTSTTTRERPFEKLLTYTMTVIPPAGRNWDNLEAIVSYIEGIKGMNIYKADLPTINFAPEAGTIKVEIPFELIDDPEKKAMIFNGLKALGAEVVEDQ